MAATIKYNKDAGYTGEAIVVIKVDNDFGCKIQSNLDIINTLMSVVDKRLTKIEETLNDSIILE